MKVIELILLACVSLQDETKYSINSIIILYEARISDIGLCT